MIEIIGIVLALGAIARFARGRGGSPVVTVSAALIGFLAILFAGSSITSSSDARLAVRLCAWGWVGAVALFTRFMIGARRPSPTGSWVCTNCHYTNGQHANICEACEQPWTPYQAPPEVPPNPRPHADGVPD
jgi:hypothetical protein